MPMPKPDKDDSEKDFVKRFMSDKMMVEDYPDEKQRYAICMKAWKDKDKTEMEAEISQKTTLHLLDKAVSEVQATEKPQWIKVFPKGNYFIKKLGKSLTFDSTFFGNILTAFNAIGLSKPSVDKNHEFKESYADILALNERSDGLHANIQLNKEGLEMVKGRKYKYISPAWGPATATDGTEYQSKLEAISLTNWPALEGALPEVASQLQLSKFDIVTEEEAHKMTELCKHLSIPEDSNEITILEKVKGLQTEIITLTNDLNQKKEEVETLSKQIADEKKVQLEKEAITAVTGWVREGKIHPSQVNYFRHQYVTLKEPIIELMKNTPVQKLVDENGKLVNRENYVIDEGQGKVQIEGVELSSIDTKRMSKLNLDPKNKEDCMIFVELKRKNPNIDKMEVE